MLLKLIHDLLSEVLVIPGFKLLTFLEISPQVVHLTIEVREHRLEGDLCGELLAEKIVEVHKIFLFLQGRKDL